MRLRSLSLQLASLWFAETSQFAQAQSTPAIFPDEDSQTPADYRLVWPATPGQRYEVRKVVGVRHPSGAFPGGCAVNPNARLG